VSILQVLPALDEDPAVKSLQLEGLLPAVAALAPEEHASDAAIRGL